MDSSLFWDFSIILALTLINGFFSGAEIAVLTARRGRLEQLAEKGNGAAATALKLAGDADRFLPTVQVGITLAGTFGSVVSGDRFVTPLAAWLSSLPIPMLSTRSQPLAIALVGLGLAFFTLILGELVPKRIALQHAEFLARVVAYPMALLQRATRPAIWLLQTTTRLVLTLLLQKATHEQTVSVEDIQHLIDAGTEAGLLEHQEQHVAVQALTLGDRTVTEILRPRVDIDAVDIATPAEEVVGAIAMSGFSRVPVCEGSIDHIVGFIYIKDVFLQQYLGRPIDLRRLLRPALYVPKTIAVTRLLELFQEQRTQLAIVLDEYGGTEGMVTLEDVFEMLVGDIHDEHRIDHAQQLVQREDGSWLVDGLVGLHDLQKELELQRWPEPPPRGVGTVGGLLLGLLKRQPQVGDVVHWSGLKIEIVDMDGPRIDRVLVQRVAAGESGASSTKLPVG